jgi:hypothetical protein
MAREKRTEATPTAAEISAWIGGLGIRRGARVHVVSEMAFYPNGEMKSYLSSPGHYNGVTKGRKVRLYTQPNTVLGTKEKRSLIDAREIFSIQKA